MEKCQELVGREISAIRVEENIVVLDLDGGTVELGCEGDCCAYAFFSDLEVASDLPAVITKWDDDHTEEGDAEHDSVRDTRFVKIKTTKGYIDFSLHVDHNGYYGGWYFIIKN